MSIGGIKIKPLVSAAVIGAMSAVAAAEFFERGSFMEGFNCARSQN